MGNDMWPLILLLMFIAGPEAGKEFADYEENKLKTLLEDFDMKKYISIKDLEEIVESIRGEVLENLFTTGFSTRDDNAVFLECTSKLLLEANARTLTTEELLKDLAEAASSLTSTPSSIKFKLTINESGVSCYSSWEDAMCITECVLKYINFRFSLPCKAELEEGWDKGRHVINFELMPTDSNPIPVTGEKLIEELYKAIERYNGQWCCSADGEETFHSIDGEYIFELR